MLADLAWTSLQTLALMAAVNAVYWAFTGLSPWPFVLTGTLVGGALGVILMVLTVPRRQ